METKIQVNYRIHFIPKSKDELAKVIATSFKDDVQGVVGLLSPIVSNRLHLSEVRTRFISLMKDLLWLVGYHVVEIEDKTTEEMLIKSDVVFVWSYDSDKSKETSIKLNTTKIG